MVKKECKSCAKKVERKFNYCPYCGASFKIRKENDNFGMLGRSDSNEKIQEEIKLPFGMDKIMGSLVKQLEKQMNSANPGNGQKMPKEINIRIGKGIPQMRQPVQMAPKTISELPKISEKENERRMNLPKVEVESKIRRLSDTIIYEIETPGVKKKEDIILTELATGIEIRAYSSDKCYMKFIPLKVEVIEYHVKEEKVIVEFRG
jgi:HSP20 family molecular chaperone IbpA